MRVHDATEQAYKNGERRMQEIVIELLRNKRETAMGQERIVLGEIIEDIKKLEVR